jgi:hypothetical protein
VNSAEANPTFDDYRLSMVQTARTEGDRRAFSLADEWCRRAWHLIEEWVDQGLEFEPDDLRAALGPARSSGSTGAVIDRARAAGLISSRGFVISRSPSRHGGVCRRWGPT